MAVCRRCLLPDSFPGAGIRNDGLCARCHDEPPVRTLGEEALAARLRPDPRRRFDCVVPVSGGRDSSFLLWYAVKRLGLRPLAVHYANPFTVADAAENLERLREGLGVELRQIATPGGSELRMVHHLLAGFGPLGISWGLCTFCHFGIGAVAYREAAREGAPWVLWGHSPYETRMFFPGVAWHETTQARITFRFREQFRLQVVPFLLEPLRAHASPARLARAGLHLGAAARHALAQRLALLGRPSRDLFALKPRAPEGVEDVLFFQYIPWDGASMEATLRAELGWRAPAGRGSSWRFDCALFPATDLRWLDAHGVSLTGLHAGCLVRAGQVSTEEARARAPQRRDLVAGLKDLEARLATAGLPVPSAFETLAAPRHGAAEPSP